MRFESLFYSERLNKKHERYQLTLAGSFAILAFGIIAGFYKDENYRSDSRRLARLIGRAFNGLKNMEIVDVVIAGLTALVLGFITIFILDNIFQNRKIIVAFEIDQTKQSVIFETKKLGGKQSIKNEYSLGQISFSNRNLKDGINNDVFDCLEFKKDQKSIGILYLDHPMWSIVDSIELNHSINILKKLII
ncbi:hypothetical protein PY092_08945 [Muricauda sp. 334s03]|uniref:Uncharacterized protein n=1 Tax=Flagellimonas yonaguniensis TaxID=3031325 RepID=A0ABT5XYV8_9FLAO|nr:hypothetical protein [[Muricauda] yonaguniensis]MDF0716271.1 hypothetical protein [[Muricauda] yonaguniensis]